MHDPWIDEYGPAVLAKLTELSEAVDTIRVKVEEFERRVPEHSHVVQVDMGEPWPWWRPSITSVGVNT